MLHLQLIVRSLLYYVVGPHILKDGSPTISVDTPYLAFHHQLYLIFEIYLPALTPTPLHICVSHLF